MISSATIQGFTERNIFVVAVRAFGKRNKIIILSVLLVGCCQFSIFKKNVIQNYNFYIVIDLKLYYIILMNSKYQRLIMWLNYGSRFSNYL